MRFSKEILNGTKILPVFKDEKYNEELSFLNDQKLFKGEVKTAYYFPNINGNNTIYVGLGDKDSISFEDIRLSYFKVGKLLLEGNILEANLVVPKLENLCQHKLGEAISEGLLQSTYVFESHKSEKSDFVNTNISFSTEYKKEKFFEGLEEGKSLIKGIFTARNLINEPANVIYPESLAEKATEILSPLGVKVSVYGQKEIEELGMKAFLSVARASSREPKLIVMEYKNNPNSSELLAYVGKGITYDAGGLAIKPAASMDTMFCDMGGSGTVIGAMEVIATNKLPVNVVAVVAACENMIAGNAYKNGDIISSMSGKTIEIKNTDAEGRLTLADAVYYATNNLNATKIVDLATLTGACVAAFGFEVTASVTNDDKFFGEIMEASKEAGEAIWQMPTFDYYRNMNKSKVADLKNTGGRYGGMITAGLFVGEFVKENTPWIHLDIAGTAFLDDSTGYLPAGATGVMVKTLYYLANIESK